MARLQTIGAAFAAALAMGAAPAVAQPVSTQNGLLQGVGKDGVTSWLGIPYAAAPTGDLRWRAPQPAANWTGVKLADRFGPGCMQNLAPTAPGAGYPVSEDCLYLNIWAADGPTTPKRPVMVWIHGGGFNIGATSWPQTDGTALARRGVILVSTSYRLGKFGFFAHPALVQEAGGGPAGNYGLMDLIAALKWVKANISAFGGDPDNVTIFGESAGGGAVSMLMASPLARGLFEKAIAESPGPFNLKDLKAAESDGVASAKGWGVAGDDPAALRALPAATVLGNAAMMQGGSSPMVDGKVLPSEPLDAFRAGAIARVPYMVGTNSYEAGLFPDAIKGLEQRYASNWKQIQTVYDGYGTHADDGIKGQLATDLIMTYPGRQAARGSAAAGNPTYVYSFNYLRPSQRGKVPGALHFDEVYEVFGTEPTAPGKDANDAAIVDAIQSRWTSFARTGAPSPDWPRYQGQNGAVEVFTDEGPKVEHGYETARMALDENLTQPKAP
jgi:para-nitrobenzyl esterase